MSFAYSSRTWRSVSASVPELSITWSASLRFSSIESCAPHALGGVLARRAVARDLPLDLRGLGRVDHDHLGNEVGGGAGAARLRRAGGAPFEQQRDVEHHERRARAPRGLEAPHHLGAHRGVHEIVEALPRRRVLEHELPEALAVERAVRPQHLGPEGLGDARDERCARRLELVDDRVRIDHHRAEARQQAGHGALAGADAPRESHHARHPPKMTHEAESAGTAGGSGLRSARGGARPA